MQWWTTIIIDIFQIIELEISGQCQHSEGGRRVAFVTIPYLEPFDAFGFLFANNTEYTSLAEGVGALVAHVHPVAITDTAHDTFT